MNPKTMLYGSGVIYLLVGLFHMLFWHLFNWQEELARLSAENAAIMQMLNVGLIILLLLMAYLAFFHTTELLSTKLGRAVLYGFAVFWLVRLAEEFIFAFFGASVSLAVVLVSLLAIVLTLLPVLSSRSGRANGSPAGRI